MGNTCPQQTPSKRRPALIKLDSSGPWLAVVQAWRALGLQGPSLNMCRKCNVTVKTPLIYNTFSTTRKHDDDYHIYPGVCDQPKNSWYGKTMRKQWEGHKAHLRERSRLYGRAGIIYWNYFISRPGADQPKSRPRVFTQEAAGMKKLWESYEKAMKQ